MKPLTAPVQLHERAMILDVLRGFAICGILFDNMFAFTGYFFLPFDQMQALPTWPADGILGLLELAFIHGKFYSLFSLLFGIGFSIILLRHQSRGANPVKLFYRRIGILLLIGAVHLVLLWPGDILFLYALVGLVLPLFRHASNRALLIWAAGLIASPVLIDAVKVLLQVRTGEFLVKMAEPIDQRNGVFNGEQVSNAIFGSGSGWKEFWAAQQTGFYHRYADLIETNRFPKVLGMFLIGFYVGRNMMYARLQEHKALLLQLRKWGFWVGIPANLLMAWLQIDGKDVPNAMGWFDTLSYAVGVVPLSLAYTASIVLWWMKKDGNTAWKRLAPVGRMALTNYLGHTVICMTLFYAVGFGLGGRIGPAIFFPAALGIYVLQVVYSNVWLRYFQYGPMEWIWRQLTYGKRLPLRKRTRQAAMATPTEVNEKNPIEVM